MAFPKGWLTPPRMGQVLVWFKESKKYDYPQILVTAEDFEEVMNVTASTAAEFVRALSTRLRKKIPDLQVAPIRVGDRYGALYRRVGRVKSDFIETEIERLVIETVVEGRKYTFELRTYPGHTEKYAPYLYTVFSGTKFLKPGAPSAEKPPEKPTTETPPEQPPAKPETHPEKPKTEPAPAEPPAKPAEPPPEKPKPKETSKPEPKQPPQTKPPEEKPKSEPAEKPKKKKKGEFEIIE
ncbi:MAG TPA: hypothetical protein PK777_07865 [Thermoguttaceae bacterium]|nr:hypothetical protein [Thermoguttaceae bacterium]